MLQAPHVDVNVRSVDAGIPNQLYCTCPLADGKARQHTGGGFDSK